MIQATVGHQSGALRELVRSGADLNLQNQVRYTFTVDTALHCTMYHSILGGSHCSYDISKEWEDRGHRYSPNWRKH